MKVPWLGLMAHVVAWYQLDVLDPPVGRPLRQREGDALLLPRVTCTMCSLSGWFVVLLIQLNLARNVCHTVLVISVLDQKYSSLGRNN